LWRGSLVILALHLKPRTRPSVLTTYSQICLSCLLAVAIRHLHLHHVQEDATPHSKLVNSYPTQLACRKCGRKIRLSICINRRRTTGRMPEGPGNTRRLRLHVRAHAPGGRRQCLGVTDSQSQQHEQRRLDGFQQVIQRQGPRRITIGMSPIDRSGRGVRLIPVKMKARPLRKTMTRSG